jgi:hypothetical protein
MLNVDQSNVLPVVASLEVRHNTFAFGNLFAQAVCAHKPDWNSSKDLG